MLSGAWTKVGPEAGRAAGAPEVGTEEACGPEAGFTSQGLQDLRLSLYPASFSLLAWKKANNAHIQHVYKYEMTTRI